MILCGGSHQQEYTMSQPRGQQYTSRKSVHDSQSSVRVFEAHPNKLYSGNSKKHITSSL